MAWDILAPVLEVRMSAQVARLGSTSHLMVLRVLALRANLESIAQPRPVVATTARLVITARLETKTLAQAETTGKKIVAICFSYPPPSKLRINCRIMPLM